MRLTDRLANVKWIASVFYPLSIMLMEVLWLHPWLTWAGIWPEPDWERAPLSLVALISLVAGAFFVTRAFPRPGLKFICMQLGILLLLIFTVIRIEYGAGYPLPDGGWFTYTGRSILDSPGLVLALATAFFITWRGVSLGHSSLYFNDVARYFIFGLVALVLLIVIWRASMGIGSLESLASTIGLQVAGFFFFGLFVLALGNLQDIQRRMLPGDKKPGSIRRLVPIQLGVVAAIILLGAGVVSIFSTDFIAFLGRILSQVWHLLSLAFFYLLMPFDYLARGIAFLVEWLVSVLQGGQPQQPFQMPEFFQPGELPFVPQTAIPTDITIILKWIFFAIVALVVIALLVRTLRRIRAMRAEEDIEEIQESLWSWAGLRADLRLFLNNILGCFRRKEKRVAPVIPIPDWHLEEDVEEGLDVREIYRRLLWEASNYGVPHRHYETPGEYARRLTEAVPETEKQIGELTGIYLDYRYGEREVGASREKQANGIWRALHRLLRRPGTEPAL